MAQLSDPLCPIEPFTEQILLQCLSNKFGPLRQLQNFIQSNRFSYLAIEKILFNYIANYFITFQIHCFHVSYAELLTANVWATLLMPTHSFRYRMKIGILQRNFQYVVILIYVFQCAYRNLYNVFHYSTTIAKYFCLCRTIQTSRSIYARTYCIRVSYPRSVRHLSVSLPTEYVCIYNFQLHLARSCTLPTNLRRYFALDGR